MLTPPMSSSATWDIALAYRQSFAAPGLYGCRWFVKDRDPGICLRTIYAHFIGWRIAYPSNAEDAGFVLFCHAYDDPTFFFEQRPCTMVLKPSLPG
jgi:hypothetical protein